MKVILLFSCFLYCLPLSAQTSPGCYAPKFSVSDEHLREQTILESSKRYGAESEQVAAALTSLSIVYKERQIEKAEKCLTRALKIREQHFGSDSVEAAEIKVLLADTLEMEGKYRMAEPLLKSALATDEEKFGKKDHRLIPALYQLSNCYLSGKPLRASDAISILNRAQAIADSTFGNASAHSYRLLTMLSAAYRLSGNKALSAQLDDRSNRIVAKFGILVGNGTAAQVDLEAQLADEDFRAAKK